MRKGVIAAIVILIIFSLLMSPALATADRGDTLNITTKTLVASDPLDAPEIPPFLTNPPPVTSPDKSASISGSETYVFVTKWGTQGSGDGLFSYPRGVAVDLSGNVYVADNNNNRIQKFGSDGTFLAKWGSYGTGDGQFDGLWGIAVDLSGNVYVADSNNQRIQKFGSTGTFLTKWGSEGIGDGEFYNPRGVAVDSSGNVYVTDNSNYRIQKFNFTGSFLTKWGSYGTGDGQFKDPSGVAVDSSGNVYVADNNNDRIQKFSSDGTFLAKWGSYGTGDGQFYYPYGVAVDSSGNAYVVDHSNHRIQKFARESALTANFTATPTSGLIPLNVQFTDLSTGTPTRWTWSYGDGMSSTSQNPWYTYSVSGAYTVSLNATNSLGSNTFTRTNYITVSPAVVTPVAAFTGSPTSGTTPLTVTFTDSSTNSPTSWSWSFGDGSSSKLQNPSHAYSSAGTYTVALTATNSAGSNTLTRTSYITVSPAVVTPVASFTGTPTSGTATLTVTFTDSSTNTPTSWSWSFGDGSSSILQNPSHAYSSAGTYTVALTATNSAGSNTLTRTSYITVNIPAPVASFTGTPTSGTAPLTVTFTDTSTNMLTYSSDQNQQESGSGFITTTILPQGTSVAQTSLPEKFVPIAGATGDELHSAPLNPDFISFMKEKPYDSQVQDGTHGQGLVPSPIYRPEVRDVQMFGSNAGDRSSSYSSTFDLRTSGKVSPVKNQGNFGTCWAFATFASLESTFMPTTPTPDFSEKNLANLAGFDYAIPAGGGHMWMSTAYLARWNGPADEATDPYPTGTWTTSSTYPPVKHIQNVIFLPARSDRTDTGNIKGVLTQWGAVYSSLYWSDSFYNTAHTSYYQPASAADTGGAGHAVTIIGWDDTYAATNFNTAPAGPGAWLVKNSWGTTWGNAGYFYVSYYDKYFGSALQSGTYWDTAVFREESTSNYDTIYSYDKLGEVSDYYYSTAKTGSFANVFTATSSGTIKAVGFYTTDVNVPSTISIYKNPTSGPVGGTPAATFSETLSYMGYNTVIIPSSQQVPVTTGDKFSVVVQVTNPTNNYYIPIELNSPGYTSGIVSQYGQGYLLGSSGWTDLKTKVANSHVCVKAYTGSTTPSPTSWIWSFGDGSSSTLQNPSHAYSSVGNYTVALTATNSAGSNTLTRTSYITVSSAVVTPVANFTGTPTSGTAPLTVTFTDSSTNTPTAWIWDFGDSSSVNATVRNPIHTYASAGTYTVALTATNSAGSNTSTRTNYITVTSGVVTPVASFTGTPTSGTKPLTVTFTDTSTNTPTSWSWNFGDGSTNTTKNPSHIYTSANTYTVKLTATNSAGSNTLTRTSYITVTSGVIAPVAGFTGTPTSGIYPLTVTFADSSTNTPTSWSWNFGDGSSSILQNPAHIYSSANTYTVSLTATNAAGSNIKTVADYITVTSATSESKTGVYRPVDGFYLKKDNDNTWNPKNDLHLTWDNAAGDLPIAGDWNKDGYSETGVYRPGDGFYLKKVNDNTWDPTTDLHITWDNAAADLPIAGDWNKDGYSETGVYRPGDGFYLKMDNENTWTSNDLHLTWDNAAGDLPIAGDWNKDGYSETGVYRPGDGFYLKMDNENTWTSNDLHLTWDNAAGDLPIAGNFG